jgi:pimeloyl-ACP methyl ester carboxylesterase
MFPPRARFFAVQPVELPANAGRATIPDAAHLPSLERPGEFDRIVLAFLGKYRV